MLSKTRHVNRTMASRIDLPNEIYLKIFTYLDNEERSVVCMSVSRRWRAIAQDPSFWRELKFQNYFNDKMIRAYLQLPFVWEVVTKLELAEGQQIPDLPIPNLQTLAISRSIGEMDFSRICQFPSLATLQIKCELDHDNTIKLNSSEILQQNLRLEINSLNVRVEEDVVNAKNTLKTVRNITSECVVDHVKVQLNMYEESLKRQDVLEKVLELVPKTTYLATPNFLVLSDFSLLTQVYLFWITKVQAFQILPGNCRNLKYCKLNCVEEGAMPAVLPFENLEELNVANADMPADELTEQVLTVWKNLKVLSIELTSDIDTKLAIISRENADLETLRVSTPRIYEEPCEYNGSVTFPSLKSLEFTESSGYQVLEHMFAPVLSTLTVPGSGRDSTLYLHRVCPSVECIHLQSDTLKFGTELLRPISQSLSVVHAPQARIFTRCLPDVQTLVDMCSDLTELYLRVEPNDLKSFFEELHNILKPLKKLRTLRLWVIFQAFNNQAFYDEQVVLTDRILRNCFPSGNITWEVGKHEAVINFISQDLQRKLAFHGFQQS